MLLLWREEIVGYVRDVDHPRSYDRNASLNSVSTCCGVLTTRPSDSLYSPQPVSHCECIPPEDPNLVQRGESPQVRDNWSEYLTLSVSESESELEETKTALTPNSKTMPRRFDSLAGH